MILFDLFKKIICTKKNKNNYIYECIEINFYE